MARIQPQATGDQALREAVKYNLYFGQIHVQLKFLLLQKQHRMKIGDIEQSLQSANVLLHMKETELPFSFLFFTYIANILQI